jgi:hypothetical protein
VNGKHKKSAMRANAPIQPVKLPSANHFGHLLKLLIQAHGSLTRSHVDPTFDYEHWHTAIIRFSSGPDLGLGAASLDDRRSSCAVDLIWDIREVHAGCARCNRTDLMHCLSHPSTDHLREMRSDPISPCLTLSWPMSMTC